MSPDGSATADTPSLHATLGNSNGRPLSPGLRGLMEHRLGQDLGGVRVHDDMQAQNAARRLGARAFALAGNVYMGEGQNRPATEAGRRLLAHELTHVAQQRSGIVGQDVIQRAPVEGFRVETMEISRSEGDLAFHDTGVRLPGSPPSATFGDDGPIPASDRRAVQSAFDLAYATATDPSFASHIDTFKTKLGSEGLALVPGAEQLTQQGWIDALRRMVIHLAETSSNPDVKQDFSEEASEHPTSGITPKGGNNVYLRDFALRQGRDSLANLILHEAVHVAGVPSIPIPGPLEKMAFEAPIHTIVEAPAGLPMSEIVPTAARIDSVVPEGPGLQITVAVVDRYLMADPDDIKVEVLDGNRNLVFQQAYPVEQIAAHFASDALLFRWDGLGASGKSTESGIHSIRVVSGAALYAARDYIIRR